MRSMKLRLSTLNMILLFLTIIRISYIPNELFVIFEYVTIMYLLIFNFCELKKAPSVYFLILGYTLILTYSTHLNMQSFRWTLSSFMSGLQMIVIFSVLSYAMDKSGIKVIINDMIRIVSVFVILNDLLLLFMGYNFANSNTMYLIGNKFSVSFIHLFLACLIYYKYFNTNKKIVYWAMFVYSIGITILIQCTTGTLTLLVAIFMLLIPIKAMMVVVNRTVLALSLAIGNILIWGSYAIFQTPFIQQIVVNVFHKSSDMTGREKLYDAVLLLVADKPVLGYGYNSDIFRVMFGYGNAQNGVFNIVIQAGIVGAVLYFGALYIALRAKTKNMGSYAFFVFLYAMAVGSAIEINLGNIFILGVASLFAYNVKEDNYIVPKTMKILKKRKIFRKRKVDLR